MLDQGYINQDEYDEAINDNVYDRIQAVNVEVQSSSSTSYFVDALTEQVIDDLGGGEGDIRRAKRTSCSTAAV